MTTKTIITCARGSVAPATKRKVEAILGAVAWLEYDSSEPRYGTPRVEVVNIEEGKTA